MELFTKGDKIECEKSDIIAKKITPSVPQNHPKLGRSLKYKCKRNGTAEIITEVRSKKKEDLVHENSNLSKGDKLQAENLYVIVQNIKRIKFKIIGGHTGTHSSQLMKTNDYTFAEIEKPFAHIQNALENKKELKE